MKLGHHCVRSWNAKQQVVALPTGEAELYGVVKGAGLLIGAISMMRDLVLSVEGVLRADSSAGKGIASRRGLGEVKHLDVRNMRIQDVVRSRRIAIVQIAGGGNAAVVLIRHLDGPAIARRMKRLGCAVDSGRRKLAPAVVGGTVEEDGNCPVWN